MKIIFVCCLLYYFFIVLNRLKWSSPTLRNNSSYLLPYIMTSQSQSFDDDFAVLSNLCMEEEGERAEREVELE